MWHYSTGLEVTVCSVTTFIIIFKIHLCEADKIRSFSSLKGTNYSYSFPSCSTLSNLWETTGYLHSTAFVIKLISLTSFLFFLLFFFLLSVFFLFFFLLSVLFLFFFLLSVFFLFFFFLFSPHLFVFLHSSSFFHLSSFRLPPFLLPPFLVSSFRLSSFLLLPFILSFFSFFLFVFLLFFFQKHQKVTCISCHKHTCVLNSNAGQHQLVE